MTRPGPEDDAMLADSVGLALLVVLDSLNPDERLAFVLHDLFGVPFDEIAEIIGRSPAAARQVASRARRRVQGSAPPTSRDLPRQREVVRAFLAASQGGDFDALLAVLHPDVVLRADTGEAAGGSRMVRGARQVAEQASLYRRNAPASLAIREVTVNGGPGLLSSLDGKPVALLGFTIASGQVVELDIIADSERLVRLNVTTLID